ncbi:MAG: signal peptide peptidase SppA [Planctomycetota bacterium]|jgi:protease-4
MEPNSQPKGPQETPAAAQVVSQPPGPPARRGPRSARRWLLVLLLLGLCGSLLVNVMLFGVVGLTGLPSLDTDRKIQEKFHSHNESGRSKVAIISVEGVIMEGEGFAKRQIDRALDDRSVKALVLRVDSPGGTVTGSHYIYHHLRQLAEKRKIPIIVSMGGIAASGGYYVSMAAGDTPGAIFAEPTTWTGSIGVVIPHYNLEGLLEKLGVKEDSVASHPLKNMGSFTRPMTEEELEIFRELVEEGFAQFKDIVKAGRPKLDPKAIDELATGQVYTAKQALDNGLIDRIGFIEDAIDQAIKLAKLDKDDVKVVEYKRTPTLTDMLLGAEARGQQFDLATMLEMTAPRAYYLCTWLPSLAGSRKQ